MRSLTVCLCFVINTCFTRVTCVVVPKALDSLFFNHDDEPTPQMVQQAGYRCETHEVITEDGYILQLHRIPGGTQRPVDPKLTPVILQHGLLGSSADWVVTGPSRGLAYILADQGYDVWLGNARGNTYSRAHKSLKPDNPRFWDWTWHEMGVYDVPAVIDHVLQETNHSQLHYIGHSMGTTMFFVMSSTVPEYNARVRRMIALAPVAFMSNTASPPIRYLAPLSHQLEKLSDWLGDGQFLPRTWIVSIFDFLCKSVILKECENLLFDLCGQDPKEFDKKLLPVILGHTPAGTSTKTLVHFAQEIETNSKFQQFDYGSEMNQKKYNSTLPPQYDLTQISLPVSLIYSLNDLLATPKDVQLLFSKLKDVDKTQVNLTSFNHLDFLWGLDAKTLVYDNVLRLLEKDRRENGYTLQEDEKDAQSPGRLPIKKETSQRPQHNVAKSDIEVTLIEVTLVL